MRMVDIGEKMKCKGCGKKAELYCLKCDKYWCVRCAVSEALCFSCPNCRMDLAEISMFRNCG